MEKYTSYNYRKIINVVLLCLSVVLIALATVVKNTKYNLMFWNLIFSSSVASNTRIYTVISAVLIVIALIAGLANIPGVLRKHNNAYFTYQGFLTVIITLLLIINLMGQSFVGGGLIFLIIALVVNVLATIFNFFIVKYNYEEIYSLENNEEVEDYGEEK